MISVVSLSRNGAGRYGKTIGRDTDGRYPGAESGARDPQDGARAFVAFGATRSLSEAAKRVGKSQPSVSRDVAGLEAALGVTLLDRSTRPIRLTPEGDALLRFLDSEQTELTHLLQGASRSERNQALFKDRNL